ncbi:MAG: small multi-drug export protein [Methanomicrobiales archaeon]
MEIISLMTVFGLGILELWVAIPAGFALGINPLIIFLLSVGGNIFGAWIILLLGKNLRDRILNWRLGDDKKNSQLYHIWESYGIIGLGLSSPLLFGAWLGTALGVALEAPQSQLMFWISMGIIVWGTGITIALYYGISLLNF